MVVTRNVWYNHNAHARPSCCDNRHHVFLSGLLIVNPESRLIAFYHMHKDVVVYMWVIMYTVCMHECMYKHMYECMMRECVVVIDHILLVCEQNCF